MNMLEQIKGGLVVSCQALPDEPLHSSFIMGRMALAAKQGGAVGIRAQSKEDIIEIKKVVDLPVIGIVKRSYPDSDIYITATKKELDELFETGCEMIAMDATLRDRPNGEKLEDLVNYVHEHGVLAMADCSTYEECVNAENIGFDCVSTTYADTRRIPKMWMVQILSYSKSWRKQSRLRFLRRAKSIRRRIWLQYMRLVLTVQWSVVLSHVRSRLPSVL